MRALNRIGALLATALVALVVCTTDDPTPRNAGPLLPVWHYSPSVRANGFVLSKNHDRIGFVDTSGRLVAEPIYVEYRLCPGPRGEALVVAQADDRVDVLDADGRVVGSTQASLAGASCGPLPGYVSLYRTTNNYDNHDPNETWGWEDWIATLPDLSRSDQLDARTADTGVAVDDDWLLARSAELIHRTGRRVQTAAGGTGQDYLSPISWDSYHYPVTLSPVSTGEWPVPARSTGQQGYIDRSGRWVAPPGFSTARPFAHGYAAVSDGTSSYFVNPSLRQVSPDYGQIWPVFTTRPPRATNPLFASVLGYTVTLPDDDGSDDPETARTGLLAPDLTVLAAPGTSRTRCYQSHDTSDAACLVVDGTGPRLVRLPDGASTPLPDGFTTVLSAQLVATADGTRVFRTTTGETFDVPAPFHAVIDDGWNPGGDAYVVCESDNGLRLVLDATGAVTPLATVERTVVTVDGKMYYWAHAGDQQGWVDATGTWLYRGSRYRLMED